MPVPVFAWVCLCTCVFVCARVSGQEVVGSVLPGFQKSWNPNRPLEREAIMPHKEYTAVCQKWQTKLHTVRTHPALT
jgi:hypothetical protein